MDKATEHKLNSLLEEFVRRDYISPEKAKTINDETRFREDLGLDSLDAYEVGYELECLFGISIPDEDMQSFKTPGDVKKYLEIHKHY